MVQDNAHSLDLTEILQPSEASNPLAMFRYATSQLGADARQGLQLGERSSVDIDLKTDFRHNL